MSKVEQICEGSEKLTPREQKTVVRALAVAVGRIDRGEKYHHLVPLQDAEVHRTMLNALRKHRDRLVATLESRGTRTR